MKVSAPVEKDYTNTIEFQEIRKEWRNSGMSEADIEKLTELHRGFDVWGNGKGHDYSNTKLAYDVSKLGYENCVE